MGNPPLNRLFGLIPDEMTEEERMGYTYLIRVELSGGSRKEFGYLGRVLCDHLSNNRWVLDHRKHELAKEYGVGTNNVTVHHRPRRAPSGLRRPAEDRIKPGHFWNKQIF